LTVGTAAYLFGLKDYKKFARPAILSSLLGYVFAVFALMFDLGRYYRVPYVIGWSWGLNSILFLIAPSKIHPLWYSALLPLFFLISAVFAGISMVIIESTISHKIFKEYIKEFDEKDFDRKTIGLAKALVVSLFVYLILKILDLTHYDNWHYLNTDYGYWYLFEIVGFVMTPALILINAIKTNNAKVVRVVAFVVAFGVIVNRFNVSLIAYNWYIPLSDKYYPTWMEVALSLGVVTLIILFYRFIVRRMPILS
ncbi:MAG: NrfD/PsrC family molybdoenzyme membrane anchor subunit, partial [Thermodesulfovibrio sp.]